MRDRTTGVTATHPPGATAPARDATHDEALTAFVIDHYDRLLGLARLICRDVTDAADAVQIGLEQAWKARADLRDPDRLRSWLDRIVAREAIRVSQRRRSWVARLVVHQPDVAWLDLVDPRRDLTPELTTLRDAFAKLPADQRAVVALHHYAGYSVAETADLVGAPVETVRTRLRRATDRLRREFEETER